MQGNGVYMDEVMTSGPWASYWNNSLTFSEDVNPELQNYMLLTIEYFPELSSIPIHVEMAPTTDFKNATIVGNVRYGKLKPDGGWMALITFNLKPIIPISKYIIGHEYTHVIIQKQWQEEVVNAIPRTEKSCDMNTFARHPDLCGHPAYVELTSDAWSFLQIPSARKKMCHLARLALKKRKAGFHAYIAWFQAQMRLAFITQNFEINGDRLGLSNG